jgi:hypothetical protein
LNAAALRPVLLAALSVGALAAPAHAANSGAGAQVILLRPTTVVKVDDLDFGPVISGGTPGTVSINALTGARSTSGGVTAATGLPQRAEFQGTGGNVLVIVTGSNTATLARSGGGAVPLTATLTRARQTASGPVALPSAAVIFGGGFQIYYVGGTLTIPANQPDGDYSGSFTLTVNYF